MKLTKTGKISIKLPPELHQPLILATRQRLYFESEELDHYSFFLLYETLQRLQSVSTKRIQLRFSEFFILLTPETMQYLDEPTQLLIRDAIEERSKGTRLDISLMDDAQHVKILRAHFVEREQH